MSGEECEPGGLSCDWSNEAFQMSAVSLFALDTSSKLWESAELQMSPKKNLNCNQEATVRGE